MYRDAILRLADRIPGDVTWAVTASANLALRGFDVVPGDVDVKTDARGVRAVADALPRAVVRPIAPPGSTDADWIRSHFAVLEVAGVRVELIGDAEFRDPGRAEWVPSPPVAGNRDWVTVDGVEIPVMTLDYERRQYRARGDEARLAVLGAAP